jgi:hypothetical protein
VWLKVLYFFERTVLKKGPETAVEDVKTHGTRDALGKVHSLVLEKFFQPTHDDVSSVHHTPALIEKDFEDNLLDLGLNLDRIRGVCCDGLHFVFSYGF